MQLQTIAEMTARNVDVAQMRIPISRPVTVNKKKNKMCCCCFFFFFCLIVMDLAPCGRDFFCNKGKNNNNNNNKQQQKHVAKLINVNARQPGGKSNFNIVYFYKKKVYNWAWMLAITKNILKKKQIGARIASHSILHGC